ncbi:MAG: CapA family protein, partial [Dorea sp.]
SSTRRRPTNSSSMDSRDNALARRRRQQARLKRRRKKKILRAVVLAGLLVAVIIIVLILKAFFGFIGSLIFKDDKVKEADAQVKTTTASILSAGDIVLNGPIFESSYYHLEDDTYDFSPIFTYIKDTYAESDFTVLNFESTISDGEYSGSPNFRSPAEITTALSEAGADMLLLANDHIYDNQEEGLTLTMNTLDSNSLLYTGIRNSEEDAIYITKKINGIKVGILNYTFESGTTDGKVLNNNTVSEESTSLINTFNYNNLDAFYDSLTTTLQEMNDSGVEYTIAYIHWGTEFESDIDENQQAIAQKLCDLGINALIGTNPHVVQPVDLIASTNGNHQMLCVYSLGNHLSNQSRDQISSQPEGYTEDGLMVKLTLKKDEKGIVSLSKADFIPTWVYKNTIEENSEFYILPLDSTETLIAEASDLELEENLNESLTRTKQIVSEGIEEVQTVLPISAK